MRSAPPLSLNSCAHIPLAIASDQSAQRKFRSHDGADSATAQRIQQLGANARVDDVVSVIVDVCVTYAADLTCGYINMNEKNRIVRSN